VGKMKCKNEKCGKEATLQFDHNGELIYYCDGCFEAWKVVMDAIGSFVPTAYPVGTKPK